MESIGHITPSDELRAGRQLRAGSLTATLVSRRSGRHVTLRFRCSHREEHGSRRWPTVPYEHASHVFIEDPKERRVATFYPQSGQIWYEYGVTDAAQWAVRSLLCWLSG